MWRSDEITFEINAKDIYRKSSLVIAVYNRDFEMIELLLKNKVPIDLTQVQFHKTLGEAWVYGKSHRENCHFGCKLVVRYS